jgi:hypothetical protein
LYKSLKQQIQIPTDTVRDPNLTENDFAFILYLKLVTWQCRERYTFEAANQDIKQYTRIADNKTIKKSLKNLYVHNYLLEPIEELKQNKPIRFVLNREKFDTKNRKEDQKFTQLPAKILYALKDGKLNRKEVRLLYYLGSYINLQNPLKQFCFVSIERMTRELNMSENTIIKHYKLLEKKKLIEIDKHKLDYGYEEDGTLIWSKYNNHYFLRYEKIADL